MSVSQVRTGRESVTGPLSTTRGSGRAVSVTTGQKSTSPLDFHARGAVRCSRADTRGIDARRDPAARRGQEPGSRSRCRPSADRRARSRSCSGRWSRRSAGSGSSGSCSRCPTARSCPAPRRSSSRPTSAGCSTACAARLIAGILFVLPGVVALLVLSAVYVALRRHHPGRVAVPRPRARRHRDRGAGRGPRRPRRGSATRPSSRWPWRRSSRSPSSACRSRSSCSPPASSAGRSGRRIPTLDRSREGRGRRRAPAADQRRRAAHRTPVRSPGGPDPRHRPRRCGSRPWPIAALAVRTDQHLRRPGPVLLRRGGGDLRRRVRRPRLRRPAGRRGLRLARARRDGPRPRAGRDDAGAADHGRPVRRVRRRLPRPGDLDPWVAAVSPRC